MEEVFAERGAGHGFFEIAMRGRDDAHVTAHRHVIADALEHAFLQHAQQLHLHRRAHVADLVEEQRAALGDLETALAGGHRAGEGAFLMAEQLALEQLGGDRAAVHRDERPLATGRKVVDGAGGHFLAGAGLAQDQNGGVVLGNLADQRDHVADGLWRCRWGGGRANARWWSLRSSGSFPALHSSMIFFKYFYSRLTSGCLLLRTPTACCGCMGAIVNFTTPGKT